MGPQRADLVAQYERYLTCCNERRFDELGEFVSEQVSGSAPVDGLASYIDGVRSVCTAFPDYRWERKELVVEEDTIAARLIGRGTHTGPFGGIAPTGRTISTQELVIYRFAEGKIIQCWGDLFPVVRDALTAPATSMKDLAPSRPSGRRVWAEFAGELLNFLVDLDSGVAAQAVPEAGGLQFVARRRPHVCITGCRR